MQGNPGNRPGDVQEGDAPILPAPLDYVPPAPGFMEELGGPTGEATRRAWHTLAPMLVDNRTLRESDLFSLARYCQYVAEWVELTQTLNTEGFTVVNTTRNGETHAVHPAVAVRRTNEQSMANLERELGLAPESRLNLQKRLMQAFKQMPHAERMQEAPRGGGAVGFLEAPGDE